jgi:hypothetical protein
MKSADISPNKMNSPNISRISRNTYCVNYDRHRPERVLKMYILDFKTFRVSCMRDRNEYLKIVDSVQQDAAVQYYLFLVYFPVMLSFPVI